jgi:hypothetical protein
VKLPADIEDQIEHDFGQQSNQLRALLLSYLKTLDKEVDRVLRCIVFLAKGHLDTLREMIAAAQLDYRDVIFWADYEDHAGANSSQVRDFNKPFGMHDVKREEPSD